MRRFDFHQMNLIPKKCIIASRSLCDTTTTLGPRSFRLPIIPANMECVMNDSLAEKLASHNYFYIHHRFQNNIVLFAQKMKSKNLPISISIGVNQESQELLEQLLEKDIIPDYITIDIAHGHSEKVKEVLQYLHNIYKQYERCPYFIVGNVSTPEAVQDLESWGADAIKVGIGPGSACTTYTMTGFGSRNIQASIIEDCVKAKRNPLTKIIADGGIREPGDITKSLALGADFVMIGGLFSGLTDSPGNLVTGIDGKLYKEFWGSASEFQSGKRNRIEGKKTLVPAKNHGILDELKFLEECLQSSISYGGGNTLECLKSIKYILH